ncbi:hypothetical protein TPAR_05463 [Tolypocladium paradoxum]|uniref:Uncharacterized protein n=1 Tax=Tolypocladium paradoxum TaxID=94208 RepID=A0A2S4KVU7_9HYPO|nr:hypothetical protein TPAR_05463 [Tolypocladium paradoxum]
MAQETKHLFEITDHLINAYYVKSERGGQIVYDLHNAIDKQEETLRQVESSGIQAQMARRTGGSSSPGFQLLSQRIANNPNMGIVKSSGEEVRKRRENSGSGEPKAM